MSCAVWEERVALFAGGDLETAEAAGVERHLTGCAACSALAQELRLELDGLRQVHAEPLATEHYAAVRGRVLAELAKSPRRGLVWPWAWAAALAVAAAAVLMVVMMKPAAVPATVLPRVVAVAPPAHTRGNDRSLTVAAPKRIGVGRAGTPAHVERAALPAIEEQKPIMADAATPTPPAAAEDSPVRMVQLATDDPNVVIYWLFEEKGEER